MISVAQHLLDLRELRLAQIQDLRARGVAELQCHACGAIRPIVKAGTPCTAPHPQNPRTSCDGMEFSELAPKRRRPVTGPAFVGVPVTRRRPRSRLARLLRLRFLTWDSEFAADPCTPERAARARRHDRIAHAHRSELARVLGVEG